MFLPADPQLPVQPVRRRRQRAGRIAAPELIIRQHPCIGRDCVLDRHQRRRFGNLDDGQKRRPPRGQPRRRDDGEHGLAVEHDRRFGQHRFVAERRRDIVPPRHILRSQNRDDTRRAPHGVQVQRRDGAARAGRQATGDVQGACGLADIVDINRSPRHMQMRRVVGVRARHDVECVIANRILH